MPYIKTSGPKEYQGPYWSQHPLYKLPPPVEKVVMVPTGDCRIGLVVDELLGDHQTVINPLSRLPRDVVLRLIEFGRSREERLRAS